MKKFPRALLACCTSSHTFACSGTSPWSASWRQVRRFFATSVIMLKKFPRALPACCTSSHTYACSGRPPWWYHKQTEVWFSQLSWGGGNNQLPYHNPLIGWSCAYLQHNAGTCNLVDDNSLKFAFASYMPISAQLLQIRDFIAISNSI